MDDIRTKLCQEVVQPGVVCHECRYDLRGQSRVGRCPECGAGIEFSIAMALKPRQQVASPWVSVTVVALAWMLSTIMHRGVVLTAGMVAMLGCAMAVHDLFFQKDLRDGRRGIAMVALIGGFALPTLIVFGS